MDVRNSSLQPLRSPDGAILSQPLQLLSQLPSSCLQSGLTNRRMSEKWALIKQPKTISITIAKHSHRQICSCCPVFHRRSKWTTLSNQQLIWNKPLSLQLLNMLYNRYKTSSQLHTSCNQTTSTLPASEARYASNASCSSDTISHLLFDFTGHPAAFAMARNSSRRTSATAPCSHSAPSSCNRCSFSRSCRATASSSESELLFNIATSSKIVQILNQKATIDSFLMLQTLQTAWPASGLDMTRLEYIEGKHARMSQWEHGILSGDATCWRCELWVLPNL